ncbi:hypothetical protein EYF80_046993 [Liparis tanakae]|uniref:Uncharacterized protein n=1 Tax=Liparis tanakae TaxID=230148 RepID=A0A4Z2FPX7_9TELE|nr:hypothetical protein EYF80_046993 [Liparis tanakae]
MRSSSSGGVHAHKGFARTDVLGHEDADVLPALPALLLDVWRPLLGLPLTHRAHLCGGAAVGPSSCFFVFRKKLLKLFLYDGVRRLRDAHHLHSLGVEHAVLLQAAAHRLEAAVGRHPGRVVAVRVPGLLHGMVVLVDALHAADAHAQLKDHATPWFWGFWDAPSSTPENEAPSSTASQPENCTDILIYDPDKRRLEFRETQTGTWHQTFYIGYKVMPYSLWLTVAWSSLSRVSSADLRSAVSCCSLTARRSAPLMSALSVAMLASHLTGETERDPGMRGAECEETWVQDNSTIPPNNALEESVKVLALGTRSIAVFDNAEQFVRQCLPTLFDLGLPGLPGDSASQVSDHRPVLLVQAPDGHRGSRGDGVPLGHLSLQGLLTIKTYVILQQRAGQRLHLQARCHAPLDPGGLIQQRSQSPRTARRDAGASSGGGRNRSAMKLGPEG